MCGRYSLTVDASAIQELFPFLRILPKCNPVSTFAPWSANCIDSNDGKERLDFFQMGVGPFLGKDPEIWPRPLPPPTMPGLRP
jgi:putative SOS response-associated peptidase YedK